MISGSAKRNLPNLHTVVIVCVVAPFFANAQTRTGDLSGAAETSSGSFEKQVLPILTARCLKCHAGSSPQAGLDVGSRELLLRGGASGPAIVVGEPEKSLLFQRIREGQMPLGGPVLSSAEIDRIGAWIEQGAPAEQTGTVSAEPPRISAADRRHWAFQPPNRPVIPRVKNRKRVRTPIDAFLLAALEKKKLTLSPEADRIALLRRVTYDLIGLPPTPQEVDDFLADCSTDAYEKVVDRLLSSSHYGERWARHWLDLAGYAESEGVLAADVIRKNAWRYRDYVIRAFNADKPYDVFLKEQIAGDELSKYRLYEKLPPDVVEKLEATGFLRTAVDATREDFQLRDFTEYQWRTFFNTQQIITSSLLGLTLDCARCHDHKFEPLTQRDYYRLQAFFAGAIRPSGPVLPSYKRVIVEAAKAEQEAAEQINKPLDEVIKALKSLRAARLSQFRAKHPKGDEATEAEVKEMFPEFRAKADQLEGELKEEESQRVNLPAIRALYDLDADPPPTHILHRGDFLKPGEEVQPGIPAVLDNPERPYAAARPAPEADTTGRRTAFAEWLTQPAHPLTARVMVNHIWAWHFGRGIVPTRDNFGESGEAPANQELLDWLATEFVRRGWSIKALHRLMLNSSAYRQASRARPAEMKLDPENKLLWRMTPRRLEAEIVRDGMLAAAGKLDSTMYGEPVMTKTKPSGEIVPLGDTSGGRRSIYQLVRRSAPQSLLNVFDAPVMEINCARRTTSVSASQSLALMNSEFIAAMAEHFARRILAEAPPSYGPDGPVDPRTIEHAFRVGLARKPSAVETNRLLWFLHSQAERYSDLQGKSLATRLYAELGQALMSMNEFIYVD